MIDDGNVTSSNISDTIQDNLNKTNEDSGITGKGLIVLSQDLEKLMNKRDKERYEIGRNPINIIFFLK